MRFVLGLEYDGSAYHGWQKQKIEESIQEQVESSISSVANAKISVICAGRTDAGVHALGQILHFDTEAVRDERAWVMGTNTRLPDDIRVLWAKRVGDDFHARYSAVARFYRYIIRNRRVKSALSPTQETWCYRALDTDLMQQAADALIGEHDFSSFRAQHCQSKSPFRKMYMMTVTRKKDCISIDFIANSFLHHMVRNIVGVLIKVGIGENPPEWASKVLLARNRSAADKTASPHGLYLAGVLYPEDYGIPKHPLFERLSKGVKRFEAENL